jgi:hypothetical protein
MKFLCVDCDEQMQLEERALPGDGTLVAAFRCPRCESVVAMLTNPMETRLVSSLGVKIGGEEVPDQPLQGVRSSMSGGREDAFTDEPIPASTTAVRWSVEAVERLNGVPRFVRGMVKRLYVEYARERGITEVTPAVMDQARSDLGLEGM